MKHTCMLSMTLMVAGLPATALPLMTLDQQFDLMEKGANTALDTRQVSHDGVIMTAWLDGDLPVIIAVPRLDENGQQQGVSRYYFKQGELFGVREPEARFSFHDGHLLEWLDEHGKPERFVSKVSMQQRERWLVRRAAELKSLFVPSQAELSLDKGGAGAPAAGSARTEWLCNQKMLAMSGAVDVTHDGAHWQLDTQQVKGRVRLSREGQWVELDMVCQVTANRVTRLTWQAVHP